MLHTTDMIRKYPFQIDESYMIFNIVDNKPDIINSIHKIAYIYDGIIMEGFLNYELGLIKDFNIKYYNELIRCITFINKLKLENFKAKHADIPMLDTISNIYALEINDIINVIQLTINKQINNEQNKSIILYYDTVSKDKLIYLVCYLLDHLSKHNEHVNFNYFNNYIKVFMSNIDIINEYIKNIANRLKGFVNGSLNVDILSSIGIAITKDDIDIQGEADLIIKDWLFDVKCSNETIDNINTWHRQLEVYNECLKKNNIGIINILNNHIIIYHSKDDFHKCNLKQYVVNEQNSVVNEQNSVVNEQNDDYDDLY